MLAFWLFDYLTIKLQSNKKYEVCMCMCVCVNQQKNLIIHILILYHCVLCI